MQNRKKIFGLVSLITYICSVSCSAVETAATTVRPPTAAEMVPVSAAVIVGHIEKYVYRSIDKSSEEYAAKFRESSKLDVLYAVVRVDEVIYQNKTVPNIQKDTIIPVNGPLGDIKCKLIGKKMIFILETFAKSYSRLSLPERYTSRVSPTDLSERNEIESAVEKIRSSK
ncbi:hypothetical protein [Massilia sp. TWP1-3-3]|uniref:hypothetical protein n=1 Tax=Massilia sp. TWP1-3-3 TaxID=2804573 RepID=UPI003CF74A71